MALPQGQPRSRTGNHLRAAAGASVSGSKTPASLDVLTFSASSASASKQGMFVSSSDMKHGGQLGSELSSPVASANVVSSLHVGGRPTPPPRLSITQLGGIQRFHHAMAQTRWYRSPAAIRCKNFMHRKDFALFMFFALFVALFMPDTWVIIGKNSNTALDVILTIIMALFTLELLALSLSDAFYLFSFFFFMDTIGTVSMVIDISYVLGTGATEVDMGDSRSSDAVNLMFLRAARAAKVGARAGRLSRVVRFLRFLPFLAATSDADDSSSRGISARLSNLLATRVALLTIILIMVVPLFEILSFPQTDHSFQTWTERLAYNVHANRTSTLVADLNEMSEFYNRHDYGPFLACLGQVLSDDFICQKDIADIIAPAVWSPKKGEPPARASILVHHHDGFIVGFNMHSKRQVDRALAMGGMAFIVVMMIFGSLTLSSAVSELAVRPWERMLNTVKMIAVTVFNFTAKVDETGSNQEEVDIDNQNEIELLEKVVSKLAVIADLQASAAQMHDIEDMGDEDIGILNMVEGKNLMEEKEKHARRSVAMGNRKKPVVLAGHVKLEDALGVSQETFYGWGLDVISLQGSKQVALVLMTISRFHGRGESFVKTPEDETVMHNFVEASRKEYQQNPFHNFSHAADVTYAVSRYMRLMSSEAFLTELEQHALLIASVSHDLGHPGVTNGFLMDIGHELAIKYNDRSPLENMHCAKLYTMVAKDGLNIFKRFSTENYKECRKGILEAILHTDMMKHPAMVKDLQLMYQMNVERFGTISYHSKEDLGEGASVFNQASSKPLVMNTILHAADISNPCRTWPVTHAWAMKCLEEFFAQGDQEKAMGITVQFLNDREKVNRPNSQIGFIEFVIAPFVVVQIKLWRRLLGLGDNLAVNLSRWEEMWIKEMNPSEEDREKVHSRVKKVQASLEFHML